MPPCASSTALPNEPRTVRIEVVIRRGQLEQPARRVHRVLRVHLAAGLLCHDEAQPRLPGLRHAFRAHRLRQCRIRLGRKDRVQASPPISDGPSAPASAAARAAPRSGCLNPPMRWLSETAHRSSRPPGRDGNPRRHDLAPHAQPDCRDGRGRPEKQPVRNAPRPPSEDASTELFPLGYRNVRFS